MRDESLMLSLLREMAESDDGTSIVRSFLGMSKSHRQRRHNVQLLVDQGSAEWMEPDETTARITNEGYEKLKIYDMGVASGGPTVRVSLSPGSPNTIDEIWSRIVAHEGKTFMTSRSFPFTYKIAGDYDQRIRVFRENHEINRNISRKLFEKASTYMPCTKPADILADGIVGRSYVWGILSDSRIWLEKSPSRNIPASSAQGNRSTLSQRCRALGFTNEESETLTELIAGHNNPTRDDPIGQSAWAWLVEMMQAGHAALTNAYTTTMALTAILEAARHFWGL